MTTIVLQSEGRPSEKSSFGNVLGGTIIVTRRWTKDMERVDAGISMIRNEPIQ